MKIRSDLLIKKVAQETGVKLIEGVLEHLKKTDPKQAGNVMQNLSNKLAYLAGQGNEPMDVHIEVDALKDGWE